MKDLLGDKANGWILRLTNGDWVVIRPGDMMFETREAAVAAALSGLDIDQKVGCHLVWESPVFEGTAIAIQAKQRWAP